MLVWRWLGKVLFSDKNRCIFSFRSREAQQICQDDKRWAVNPGHVNEVVNHTQHKMFYSNFSFSGVGLLTSIEGMMNSDKYIDVILRKVISNNGKGFLMVEEYSNRILPSVFCLIKWRRFRKYKVNILVWPGHSPDPNTNENVWSITKTRLQILDGNTITKLIDVIIQVLYRDSKLKKTAENW